MSYIHTSVYILYIIYYLLDFGQISVHFTTQIFDIKNGDQLKWTVIM